MPLTFKEVCEKLEQLDEITILEVLDVSSKEFLKFEDKIEDNIEELTEDLEDNQQDLFNDTEQEIKLDIYQTVIASSRYARYIPELKRRETWEETVDRMINYLKSKHKYKMGELIKFPGLEHEFKEIKKAVLNLEIMPSMRLMMSAGEACE